MLEHILPIGRPVLEPPKKPYDLWVYAGETEVKDRLFSFLFNGGIHFFLDLLNNLFYPGWVYPSVGDQFFQAHTGYFPPHRVKAGQGYEFRGVIDNEVLPRGSFQGTDVPPLPSDDPSFHFIVGEAYCRHCAVSHIVAG